MSTQPQVRAFTMADASLKQRADAVLQSVQRDATEFATRNVVTTTLDAYQALIDDFNDTSTDEELRGYVTTATEVKDASASSLRQAISSVRNMAEVKFGTSAGQYKSFGFDDLARLSDDDLYRTAKRIVRIGNKFLSELASEGLTAAILTNIETLNQNFDTDIDTVQAKIEDRDLETQDRVIKGNALYTETIRLGSIGKSLFEFTNEAKYNDYVIVETSSTPTPAPEN